MTNEKIKVEEIAGRKFAFRPERILRRLNLLDIFRQDSVKIDGDQYVQM